jgi:hypothetical protein
LQYYRIYLDVLTIPLFLIAYVVPQVSYLHFPYLLISYVIPQVRFLHFGFIWLGMNAVYNMLSTISKSIVKFGGSISLRSVIS